MNLDYYTFKWGWFNHISLSFSCVYVFFLIQSEMQDNMGPISTLNCDFKGCIKYKKYKQTKVDKKKRYKYQKWAPSISYFEILDEKNKPNVNFQSVEERKYS